MISQAWPVRKVGIALEDKGTYLGGLFPYAFIQILLVPPVHNFTFMWELDGH